MGVEEALRSVDFFEALTDDEFKRLAAVAVPAAHPAGSLVVGKDDPADGMYVVIAGSLRVSTPAKDGHDLVLATLGVGDYFGEQALLGDRPGTRNAYVHADSDAESLFIPVAAFRALLTDGSPFTQRIEAEGEARSRLTEIRQSFFFAALQVDEHPEACTEEIFQAGETVVREGEAGDCAYLVLEGRIRVEVQGVEVTELGPGQCFGERAVLDDLPRSATAVAKDKLTVVRVSPEHFRERHAALPRLQEGAATLRGIDELPRRLVTTQRLSIVNGRECISTTCIDAALGTIETCWALGETLFTLTVSNRDLVRTARYIKPMQGIQRAISLDVNGRIAALTVVGEWDEIPLLYDWVVDEVVPDDATLAGFEENGSAVS